MSFNMAHPNIRKHLLKSFLGARKTISLARSSKMFGSCLLEHIMQSELFPFDSAAPWVQFFMASQPAPQRTPPHRKKALWSGLINYWCPLISISPWKSLDVYLYVFILLSVLIQGTLSAKDQQTGIDLPKTVKICCFLAFPHVCMWAWSGSSAVPWTTPFQCPPTPKIDHCGIDGKDVFFIKDKGMFQKRPVLPPILSQVYTLIYLQYGVLHYTSQVVWDVWTINNSSRRIADLVHMKLPFLPSWGSGLHQSKQFSWRKLQGQKNDSKNRESQLSNEELQHFLALCFAF